MTTTPRRSGHPGYSETMTRTPATAAKARRLARVALCTWGMAEGVEDAALLMSELFANAVRHARGNHVRVIIDRPDKDRVYLAVIDRAPHQLPEMRAVGPKDIGGRGLVLVDELADRWGYDLMGSRLRPWGKCVWAEMKVTR